MKTKQILFVYISILTLAACAKAPLTRSDRGAVARIVGGYHTSSPSVVAFISDPVPAAGNGRYECSGSVVDNQFVLTAAHCVPATVNGGPGPSSGSVYFGDVAANNTKHVDYVVRKQPGYTVDDGTVAGNYDDIALLHFQGGLPSGYSPVTFLRSALKQTLITYNSPILRMGYGYTGPTSPSDKVFGTLRAVQVPFYSEDPSLPVYFTTTVGVGACEGDSGGPDFFNFSGIPLQIGIILSGDSGCTGSSNHSLETSPYLPWMQSVGAAPTVVGYNVAYQSQSGYMMRFGSDGSVASGNLPMDPGLSPSIAVRPDGYYLALSQVGSASPLYTQMQMMQPNGSISPIGWGMSPGTNPSIIAPANNYWKVAFQANTGTLFTGESTGALTNFGLGMMPGTSPSMANSPVGTWIAMQANSTLLWVVDPSGYGRNLGLGMDYQSNPSVAGLTNGHALVAMQSNAGYLITDDVAFNPYTHAFYQAPPLDLRLGMTRGTSPAVAPLPNGNYILAFQSYSAGPTKSPELWYVVGGAPGTDTHLPIAPGTSPSITTDISTGLFEIAYQTDHGTLAIFGSLGFYDTGLSMRSGTSPSIAER